MEITKAQQARIDLAMANMPTTKDLPHYVVGEVFKAFYGGEGMYCVSWGQFLLYTGKYYRRVDESEIQQILLGLIIKFYPSKAVKITSSLLIGIYQLLAATFPKRVTDEELGHEYFAFKDGVYNTVTHERVNFSPEVWCFKYINCLMADFEKDAPVLNIYLGTTLVKDRERDTDAYEQDVDLIALYQEMVGCILSSEKEASRAFFLYGEGANGKSVTTEFILSLFEPQYISSASLETLSQRFGKSTLVGKVVNVCSEEESPKLRHDIFKALVTGEQIDAERKHEHSFSYHNFARLLFSTNNYPQFSGLDYAIRRRIVVIPFHRVFMVEERDPLLIQKLKEEKAQFIWFGLQGLKRLQANNYQYTASDSARKAMTIFEETSSSVVRFMNIHYEADEVGRVNGMSIYHGYSEWCDKNGHTAVGSGRFCNEMGGLGWLKLLRVKVKGKWAYKIGPKLEGLDDNPTDQESRKMEQVNLDNIRF